MINGEAAEWVCLATWAVSGSAAVFFFLLTSHLLDSKSMAAAAVCAQHSSLLCRQQRGLNALSTLRVASTVKT